MMASVIMSKFSGSVHTYILEKERDLDAPLTVDFIMKSIERYIEIKEHGELYGA